MKFKERLRDLRLKKHMKSKEVAKLVGISEPTYISYENRGSQPPYEVLIKLSKVFGVTTDFLLGADQDVCQPIVNRKPFSENLKRIRMETGMSGKIIAEKLGISYSAYMNYENRASQPPFDVLCKIADVLDVTTDILLGREYEATVERGVYMLKDNLRMYRQKLGISARKMAELLRVNYGAYQHYENRGNQPPYEVLCKMADILGVTTDMLLGREYDYYQSIKQAGYSIRELPSGNLAITNVKPSDMPESYDLPKIVVNQLCDNIRMLQRALVTETTIRQLLNSAQIYRKD